MKKIKPCPFCGSEAKLSNSYNERRSVFYTKVLCMHCHAEGGPIKSSNMTAETNDEAIEHWNMRTTTTE